MTNSPRVGMNMLLWTDFVTLEHAPVFAGLASAGLDGAEIPLFEGDADHYAAIRRELDGAGLQATCSTALSPDKNAISPDAKVRQAASDHLRWAIDMCGVLGSTMLCGPLHSAFKEFTGTAATADEKGWCADVMRGAAEHAQAAGVQLAVEFLNRFECYMLTTSEQAHELVRAVDHPSFSVHWDTHHAHIEEKDVGAGIRACGDAITHVHMSENDRGTPGKGQVRWRETCEALHAIGYDGWLTMEAFSRKSPDFAAAIHIWRDYFASEEEVYTEGGAFVREIWAATA